MVWISLVSGLDTKKLHNFGNNLKFYNFLNENRSQSITKEQFDKLLQQNCSNIVKQYSNSNSFIFRGMRKDEPYYFVDPTKSVRVSKSVPNHYTIMFDEILPSWKNMPKRSKSIIASSLYAPGGSQYGTHYKVYPYNDSKIGVCPNYDIWVSFEKHLKFSLDNFLVVLDNISLAYKIELKETKQSILSFMKKVDEVDVNSNRISSTTKSFLQRYKESNKTFFNYLNDIFDPNKNGFDVIKPGEKFKPYREIFIEGRCLLETTIKQNTPTEKEVKDAISTILGK